MWISKKNHDHLLSVISDLRDRLDVACERIADLRATTAGAVAGRDYLCLRVNQLEMQNAELIVSITGRPQRVAQIEKQDPALDRLDDFPQGTVSFDDMGDTAARKHGVDWDELTGTLKH